MTYTERFVIFMFSVFGFELVERSVPTMSTVACAEYDNIGTRVVNLRHDACSVYIGRPSQWGNPFVIGSIAGTRKSVIYLYSKWIMLPENSNIRHAARIVLRGKILGCYCKPLACHGDLLAVIADSESDNDPKLRSFLARISE
jgi:hypothetical protein